MRGASSTLGDEMTTKQNFARWTAKLDARHGTLNLRADCDSCHRGISIIARAGSSLGGTAFWHCGFSDRPRRKSLAELRSRGVEWLKSRTQADEVEDIERSATVCFSQGEGDRHVALDELPTLVFYQGRRARR